MGGDDDDEESPAARRERRRQAREQRKKYIEQALVVKHVIKKPAERKDSTGAETDSTTSEVHLPDPGKDTINENASPSGAQLRRIKSNLVLSDEDDLEAARDSTREPWICAICLAPYEIGDEICWSQNPQCDHCYHHECIEHWLYKHEECPMCRSIYIPAEEEDSPPLIRESTLPAPEMVAYPAEHLEDIPTSLGESPMVIGGLERIVADDLESSGNSAGESEDNASVSASQRNDGELVEVPLGTSL